MLPADDARTALHDHQAAEDQGMTDDILAIEALERRATRREERRDFFRTLGA